MSKKLLLKVAAFSKANYLETDAVIFLLCKECLAGVAKTGVPSGLQKVVMAAAEREDDLTARG